MEMNEKKKEKDVEIFINGQEKIANKGELSYEEIVTLAFGNYEFNPDVIYTILYFKGDSPKPKGELVKGESVKVMHGMIINVTRTDRS